MAVVVDLIIIVVLFVCAVLLANDRPRSRLFAWIGRLTERFGRPEHTPEWELEHAELWLMARRKQLTEDLQRIERLLLHDETMSATRQLGNRLARDQLITSLARIPDVLPGHDRSLVHEPWYDDRAAPSPALVARGPMVEVLDVGGWRR